MSNRFRPVALALGLLLATGVARADATQTLLLRDPTVSASRIVFTYAGDLWSVDRDGGDALRLTSDPAADLAPAFSPDGKTLAFNRQHGDNLEVYVMPAAGGTPRRFKPAMVGMRGSSQPET